MTPGPAHTVTLTLTATGVFSQFADIHAGLLAKCLQQAAQHQSVVAGNLDMAGNVFEFTEGEHAITVSAKSATLRHMP